MSRKIIHVSSAGRQDRQWQKNDNTFWACQQVSPGGLFGPSDSKESDKKEKMHVESQQVYPGGMFDILGEKGSAKKAALKDQQVCPGELFDALDVDKDISIEKHSGKDNTVQKGRSKNDAESKADKETKQNPKQSLLSVIGDILLQTHRFIRDEERNIYFYTNGIYQKADGISLAEFIKKHLDDSYVRRVTDPSFYNKLLIDLKSDYRIEIVDRKKLNGRVKYLVAFRNGVYDCRERKFLGFKPEFYLFSKLEVNYTENAQAIVFDKFLDTVSGGDAAVRKLIWEMISYILLPTNDGKCFFVMGTAPDSGKSLLAKVIEAMFPDSVVNRSPITAISGKFAMAPIADKRINIATECINERISPDVVNNIKLLTGEEAVNVERKGIDASREYVACKLLFATNCATAFEVADDAFWNRMRIVPFQYPILKKDQKTNLFEDLKWELDSIASIAVSKFAGPLIKSNYQFTVPEASAKLMHQWRNSRLDILKEFLECRCEVTHDLSDFISVNELYEEYCRWLKDLYCYAEPLAKQDFSRKIRTKHTQLKEPRDKEKIGDKYVRVLHGICWREDFDID